MPVPFFLVVWNGRNRFLICSGGIPHPVYLMPVVILPLPGCMTVIATVPWPLGRLCIAFRIRLVKTLLSRSGSPSIMGGFSLGGKVVVTVSPLLLLILSSSKVVERTSRRLTGRFLRENWPR